MDHAGVADLGRLLAYICMCSCSFAAVVFISTICENVIPPIDSRSNGPLLSLSEIVCVSPGGLKGGCKTSAESSSCQAEPLDFVARCFRVRDFGGLKSCALFSKFSRPKYLFYAFLGPMGSLDPFLKVTENSHFVFAK